MKLRRWILGAILLLCLSLSAAAMLPKKLVSAAEMQLEPVAYVALTFDDGPRRGTTDVLLDALRERNVPVTFFVIGEQIAGNEDLLLRMQREGHQVGNHTFNHRSLSQCGEVTFYQQINKTEILLTEVLGEGEYWLRPPYGAIYENQKAWVKTPLIKWSVDPEDWKLLNAAKVVRAVLSHAKDGDIILLHDFYPSSVQAAVEIVDRLQAQGYEFLTVRQLLQHKGIQVKPGWYYVRAGGEKEKQQKA